MKALVTGATGLIGTQLLWDLVEAGFEEINILTRSAKKAEKTIQIPVSIYEWKSPEKDLPPSKAFEGVDVVFHLAGESVGVGRWTSSKKKKILNSRVLPSQKIVERIENLSSKPKILVSSSAIGIYGSRGDEPLSVESEPGEGFLAEVCENWEGSFRDLSSSVRKVFVRTGIVLSRNGGALEQMLPPFLMGGGGRLGDGKQFMSWIHIKDLTKMMIYAAKTNSVEGSINGVSPNPVTNTGFTKTLGKAIKRPTIFPVPALAVKTLFGEKSEILLGSQRVYPEKIVENGFKFDFNYLGEALEDVLHGISISESTFSQTQFVKKNLDEVFDFFSNEKNLENLTPDYLSFKVLGKDSEKLGEGTKIDYLLKLRFIPIRWQSLIQKWTPKKEFVDTQLRGPYKRWHHTHKFTPFKSGTLIKDDVIYDLPLGPIGKIFGGWFVKRDVTGIFKYRKKKIDEIFG